MKFNADVPPTTRSFLPSPFRSTTSHAAPGLLGKVKVFFVKLLYVLSMGSINII